MLGWEWYEGGAEILHLAPRLSPELELELVPEPWLERWLEPWLEPGHDNAELPSPPAGDILSDLLGSDTSPSFVTMPIKQAVADTRGSEEPRTLPYVPGSLAPWLYSVMRPARTLAQRPERGQV